MNYLAIKNPKGKGVYQYNTKKERKSILGGLGLTTKDGQVFTNKSDALKYAQVKEVANRPQRVVDSTKQTHATVNSSKNSSKDKIICENGALKMLNKLKENGFDFATITLCDGYKFDVILRDLEYLSTTNIISSTCSKLHRYIDGKSNYYFTPRSCECERSIQNFNEFKDKVLNRITDYNKGIIDNSNTSEYFIDCAMNDIQEYVKSRTSNYSFNSEIVKSLKATKIEFINNFLLFNKTSTITKEQLTNFSYVNLFEYTDKQDSVVTDYVLNTDYILTIKPSKSEWKVTDTKFLKFNKDINK